MRAMQQKYYNKTQANRMRQVQRQLPYRTFPEGNPELSTNEYGQHHDIS